MRLDGYYYQLLNLALFFVFPVAVFAEESIKGLETEIRNTTILNSQNKKIDTDLEVPKSLKGSQNIYKQLRVGDHHELPDTLVRTNRLERSSVRPERLARPERPEIPFRINKPERPDKANRPEKPNKPDRPEKPNKPDRPGKP